MMLWLMMAVVVSLRKKRDDDDQFFIRVVSTHGAGGGGGGCRKEGAPSSWNTHPSPPQVKSGAIQLQGRADWAMLLASENIFRYFVSGWCLLG